MEEILGTEIGSWEIGCQVPFEKYGVREVGLCLSCMTEIASGNGPSSDQKRRNPAGDFHIIVWALFKSSKEGNGRCASAASLAFDIVTR